MKPLAGPLIAYPAAVALLFGIYLGAFGTYYVFKYYGGCVAQLQPNSEPASPTKRNGQTVECNCQQSSEKGQSHD